MSKLNKVTNLHLATKAEVLDDGTLLLNMILRQDLRVHRMTLRSEKLTLALESKGVRFQETIELPAMVNPMTGTLTQLDRLCTVEAQTTDKPSGWRLVLLEQPESSLELVV